MKPGRRFERWSPLVLLAALLVLWQLVVWLFSIPNFIFPGPIEIAEQFGQFKGPLLEAAWKTLFPPSYTGEALKTAIKTALSDNISERTTINFVTSWLDSIPGPSYAAFAASFEPATKGKQTKNSPNRANAQASFQKIAEGKLNEQAAAVKAKRLRILTLISSEVTASDLKTLTSALTAAIGGDSNCSTTSGIDPAIIDVCSALTAAQGNSAETAASLSSEILVAIAKQAAVNP